MPAMFEDPSLLPLFWHGITRLGEAQILLPAALLAAAWLWWRIGAPRAAIAWLLLIGVAGAVTTATKVAFVGWGVGHAALDFTGISGHAMFAAAVHPMLMRVMAVNAAPRTQGMMVALGFALALLVGVSRLQVHAHSVSEVASGFLLGTLVSLLVLGWQHIPRLHAPPWIPLLLSVWLLALPVGAPPSRSHDAVIELSLKLSGRPQAYTRWEMLKQDRLRRLPLPQAVRGTAPF
jgi:membrane-associated phospholipid phosphatase